MFSFIRLQFQQQKISHIMRTLLRRNHRNQPCKSPSPDLAAKNVIKNTTIEVEDIRSKMKKAQEKQLKFDLESSISQIAPSDNISLDHKYKQVMEEFSKLKYENKLLADQNRLLNQENQRLNLQEERNKNLSQLNNAILTKTDSEALREKIVLLDEEKKRLERELAAEREKSEQSFRNMDKLRMELLNVKGDKKPGAAANEQESRFILLSNSILADYQQKMGRKLEELNFRINRIEMMEKIIKEQHSRLAADSRVNKTPSSVKSYNWANNTTVRNDSRFKDQPPTQERSDRDALPLSSSPIDKHYKLDQSVLEKLEQENISLAEELRIRDSEIERMKIEKQRMSAVLHDIELERKAYKISTPKFNNNDDDHFRKFAGMEQANIHNEVEHLQAENSALKEELASLEGGFGIQKREYINKIEYLQKIIKFYDEKQRENATCQQCVRKDEQIAALKQKLRKADDRFENGLNELQRKFQSDIEDYQRKLQHSESAGSEKFRTLDEQYQRSKQLTGELVIELGNYKMMLEYIKDKIHLEQINQLLQENTNIYTEVESTFYQEREEYDKSISSYRQKLLEKDQKVAELESQLHLKSREVELLREEVEKLKQINLQLQDNNLSVLKTNLKFMGRERVSKGKIFDSNTEKVLELVRSGETKLDILYQKVNNTLNYDLTHPKKS